MVDMVDLLDKPSYTWDQKGDSEKRNQQSVDGLRRQEE
jgi:hypothetical protein